MLEIGDTSPAVPSLDRLSRLRLFNDSDVCLVIEVPPDIPRGGKDAGLDKTVDKLLDDRSVLVGLGALSISAPPVRMDPYCTLSGLLLGGGTGGLI